MYAALGLPYGLEHIVELFLSAHQQRHGVVVGESDALLAHLSNDERVGRLCRYVACRQ